jgi:hypothetical protein
VPHVREANVGTFRPRLENWFRYPEQSEGLHRSAILFGSSNTPSPAAASDTSPARQCRVSRR